MSWLYRYESKGIQRWILDSNQLRDLAAGSVLVEALVATARERINRAGGAVIAAAAGGATARFENRESLAAFAAEWPMYVAHFAPGLQVVQAWVEEPQTLTDLHELLAQRRNTPPAPELEAGPLVARAGRTGLPAVDVPEELRRRRPWQYTWDAAAVAKERCRANKRAVVGSELFESIKLEEDIENWPESPVAVLHADGSGVGLRLQNVTLAALPAFSAALSEATRAATRAAVEKLPERHGRRVARPVVVGGDDLTFILPAADALDFAQHWLSAFEAETESRRATLGGARLHAGAGMVFVHRAFPFATAYEHAEQECRAAKRDASGNDGRPVASALRFRRITTSRVADSPHACGTWRLELIDALRELTAAAAALPRGALRTWLGLLDRGDPKRDALWRRTREVADPRRWRHFERALEAAGADPASGLFRNQQPAPDERATPLRDALALLHVLRRARGREG